MPKELAITARQLGFIALDNYCPSCLRVQLLFRFQPPYSHFGAQIFGDSQRCQEAILGYYFANDGCLPKEFEPFCSCIGRVEHPNSAAKYRCTHKSGVVLYGVPDEVLRLKDDSLCLVDHKTAHNKGEDDKFHAQYETQIIGYSYVAEALGLGEVTRGALFYWEALVTDVQEDPSAHYKRAKLLMPFKVSPLEVKIDYNKLDPLIRELKRVASASGLPAGRKGCEDCAKRELLVALDQEYTNQDRAIARYSADDVSARWAARDRLAFREDYRQKLLAKFGAVGNAMFSPDGIMANWYQPPTERSGVMVVK